jgi:hypothetical protein
MRDEIDMYVAFVGKVKFLNVVIGGTYSCYCTFLGYDVWKDVNVDGLLKRAIPKYKYCTVILCLAKIIALLKNLDFSEPVMFKVYRTFS